MYAFTYWHAYYDSAFLSHPFKLSEALYQDLQITSSHFSSWPPLEILPELPRLFETLEQFILDGENWMGCMCTEGQIIKMQKQINNIMLHLQCEKRYGFQLWQKSSRRVQASIIHFVIFLKRLVSSMIPQDCRNILQAYKAQKLATQMSKLQCFMNQLIKNIKPIHHFLFAHDFQEETALTKQFFQEFNELIHTLPRIKKPSLTKTPKLMQYICVLNPIEADEYESQRSVSIRRKNATVLEKPKKQKKYSLEKHNDQGFKNFKIVNNSIVKTKHKKNSLEKYLVDQSYAKNIQFFRFSDNFRKYSIYNKPKKQTVTSLDTRQRNSQVDKDRSPSHDRSFANDLIKLKTRTIATDIRLYSESDVRSREMSRITARQMSMRKIDNFDGDQREHERDEKTKKKKALKLPIKTTHWSQQIKLNDGSSNGWGRVREYLNKRIGERKLKRLIYQ